MIFTFSGVTYLKYSTAALKCNNYGISNVKIKKLQTVIYILPKVSWTYFGEVLSVGSLFWDDGFSNNDTIEDFYGLD